MQAERSPETKPGDVQTQRTSPAPFYIDMLLAIACALFALLWNWPFLRVFTGAFDEGIVLQGAVRVLQGQIPYRDFFAFYTPGSYFLFAGLFKVFSISLVAARAVLLAYGAIFASLTFLLARRFCTRYVSLICALLVTLACLPMRFNVIHNWDSTAFALLAMYCVVRALGTQSISWTILAGLFAGTTLMVEQSKGAGLMLGLFIAIFELWYLESDRWRLTHLGALLAGALAPVCVIFSFFAAHAALRPMIEDWSWPLRHYGAANRLPYAFVQWSGLTEMLQTPNVAERTLLWIVLLGFFALATAPILLFAQWIYALTHCPRVRAASGEFRILLFCTPLIFGCWLSTLATRRADMNRIGFLLPLMIFLFPLLGDARVVRLPGLQSARKIIAAGLLVSCLLASFLFRMVASSAKVEIQTRRGIVRATTADPTLTYLIAHSTPGERVLVYPYAPDYSFLSGTLSPLRLDYLQPGMHSEDEFRQALSDLRAHPESPVLFEIAFPERVTATWPATPAEKLATDPMTDFVLSQRRPCRILRTGSRTFVWMLPLDETCQKN